MISRKTAMVIADQYTLKFTSFTYSTYGNREVIHADKLYDFLYENEYEPWFCNVARQNKVIIRNVRDFFLQIHTGESFANATPNWSWDQRQTLGQQYLKYLARDMLNFYKANMSSDFEAKLYKSRHDDLLRRLEIDGYIYRDRQIYQSEADVLNVEEEIHILDKLYTALGLPDRSTALEFLKLSEEHYLAGRWPDSVSNSRKFFESVLKQVARQYASYKSITFNEETLEKPVEVRRFLESNGLLEKKEREAIAEIYGLLSHTGSHPYMAEKDQARLLRQISLTMSQFIMLRLEGAMKKEVVQ